MTIGTCLCGAVRYEIEPPYRWMTHCHCSMCRKHHGSLYGTTVGVEKQNFRWLQGEEAIVHYRASPSFERPFCRHCGSVVPETSTSMAICPAGNLADDLDAKPQAHIFVKSKSPMHEITDSLRQFDEYPPGYGASVDAPAHTQAASTASASGSCLCGAVAFEIDAAPTKVLHCHCSRCRLTRGAPHASNVFVPRDALRWIRGADQVRSFKVADARMFSTSFCMTCGSLLPALFERMGHYNLPLGSLDTPLATQAGAHIFVGSKAPWFEITDRLPQFEALPPKDRIAEVFFG